MYGEKPASVFTGAEGLVDAAHDMTFNLWILLLRFEQLFLFSATPLDLVCFYDLVAII